MDRRGQSARDILADALEIKDLQRRSMYLAQACGNDSALRNEVEELIEAQGAAGHFLPDRPATGWVQEALVNAEEANNSLDSFCGIPLMERPGHQIGRYKLLYKLGEGGCGVVYLAEQREPVRRRVALKIIKLGMDTKQVVSRFKAEQQALALMDHPNIAKVFDAGATQS